MADVLHIAQYYGYLLDWRQFLVTLFFVMLSILVGVLLYALCQPFVSVRQRWGRLLLILTMGLSSAMVIWVGDPNLLYTFPIFVIFFMLATSGNRLGRLAMCFIFFCLIMSISALLDTYFSDRFISRSADYIVSLGRPLFVGIIYLCYPAQAAGAAVTQSVGAGVRSVADAAVRPRCNGAAHLSL